MLKLFSGNKLLVLLIFWWCLLFAWRPFFLGFYHDDWVMLSIRGATFDDIFIKGMNRPLLVMLLYLMVGVVPKTSFAWHAIGAIIALLVAFSVYYACKILISKIFQGISEPSNSFAGLIGALLWLTAPWALGFNAWPVMFLSQLSVAFFCLSLVILLSNIDIKKKIAYLLIFQLTGFALYEAFWLACVPLYLIYLVAKKEKDSLFTKVSVAVVLCLCQLSAIIMNRYAASYGAVSKSFNDAWANTFSHQFLNLPATLLQPFGKWAWLLMALLVSALLCVRNEQGRVSLRLAACWALGMLGFLFIFIKPLPNPISIYSTWLLIGACCISIYFYLNRVDARIVGLLACIVGVLLSVLLNAMAGYGFTGKGLFSRTSMAMTLWSCLGIAIFVAHAQLLGAICFRNAAFLGIIIISGLLTYQQAGEWQSAWANQKVTIANLTPLANDANGTYLVETNGHATVEGFAAYWDIEAAIKGEKHKDKNDKRRFFSTRNGVFNSTWDGEIFSQSYCGKDGVKVWEFHAERVYFLPFNGTSLIAMDKGMHYGCK
jgi:hypothetical protein